MLIRALTVAVVFFLASGCAFFRPLIESDPARLVKDLVIYEKAKTCRSEKLDLIIYARRPIENPEEEIWTEDIRIDVILRRINETITITRYHNAEISPKTGKIIPRTFYDFPDMQLIDEDLEWNRREPTVKELQKIFKNILSSREIYLHELGYLRELKRELQTEYNKVVEECLYGFRY